jgi:hypothetical protein
MSKTLDEQVEQSAIRVATADLCAENARLQELVPAMEWAHSLIRDKLEEESDGYKALAERHERALVERDRMLRWTHGYLYRTPRTTVDGAFGYLSIKSFRAARAAIDATPEEAREKEGK